MLQLVWVVVGSILKEFKKYAITAGTRTKSLQCLHPGQIAVRIKEPEDTNKRRI